MVPARQQRRGAAANEIKVLRGAAPRGAGGARLSWSNGATSRPCAVLQRRRGCGGLRAGQSWVWGARSCQGREVGKGKGKEKKNGSRPPRLAALGCCALRASSSSRFASNKRDKMGLLLKTTIVSNSETKQLVILLWRGKARAVNR